MLEGDECYEALEELINMQEPPLEVLRLLCLQSMTDVGIKAGKYDFFKREIVQTYGYEYLYTLNNLEQLGLLRRRESKVWVGSGDSSVSPWPSLRRSLRLINDAVNVHDPDDISYVSSGYAPLSARLVVASVRPGWTVLAETMKLLPGPTVEIDQDPDKPEELAAALQRRASMDVKQALWQGQGRGLGQQGLGQSGGATLGGTTAGDSEPGLGLGLGGDGEPPKKKVMMVYYVGGVTYMEIAALRFLSKQRDCEYMIALVVLISVRSTSILLWYFRVQYTSQYTNILSADQQIHINHTNGDYPHSLLYYN
ncbi:unnamed protein product [Discosporangium mesarthrocarpum]